MVITISNLDYDTMQQSKHSSMKARLIDEVKKSVVSQLPSGKYTKSDIEVALSKGSIKATVKILPKTGETTASLKSAMTTKRAALATSVTSAVKAIGGIDAVLEPNKKIADIAASSDFPVEEVVPGTSDPIVIRVPSPSEDDDDETEGAVKGAAIGAAAVAILATIAGVGYFKVCRRKAAPMPVIANQGVAYEPEEGVSVVMGRPISGVAPTAGESNDKGGDNPSGKEVPTMPSGKELRLGP